MLLEVANGLKLFKKRTSLTTRPQCFPFRVVNTLPELFVNSTNVAIDFKTFVERILVANPVDFILYKTLEPIVNIITSVLAICILRSY